MIWTVVVAKTARKQIGRIPARDGERIATALRAMAAGPFQGDIMKLEGLENSYRRRVGNYRVFFRVDRASGAVGISAIVRRTSTTY